MYKLVVFVPEEALEQVKQALFQAGAGQMGDYAQCCWQVKGLGQFMPLAGSDPHIGSENTLERVEEWRVEMVVPNEVSRLLEVIAALKSAHPYETPAYEISTLFDV